MYKPVDGVNTLGVARRCSDQAVHVTVRHEACIPWGWDGCGSRENVAVKVLIGEEDEEDGCSSLLPPV